MLLARGLGGEVRLSLQLQVYCFLLLACDMFNSHEEHLLV